MAGNEHAAALGALGASKGGTARAAALSPEARRSIAQRAAAARWGKGPPPATTTDVVSPEALAARVRRWEALQAEWRADPFTTEESAAMDGVLHSLQRHTREDADEDEVER